MFARLALQKTPSFFSRRLISTSRTVFGPKIVYLDSFPRLHYTPLEEQAKKFGTVKNVDAKHEGEFIRFANVEFDSEDSAQNFQSHLQTTGLTLIDKKATVLPRALLLESTQETQIPPEETSRLVIRGIEGERVYFKHFAKELGLQEKGILDTVAMGNSFYHDSSSRIMLNFHTIRDASNALKSLSDLISQKYPGATIEYSHHGSTKPPRPATRTVHIPHSTRAVENQIEELFKTRKGVKELRFRPISSRELKFFAIIECDDVETAKKIKEDFGDKYYIDYMDDTPRSEKSN